MDISTKTVTQRVHTATATVDMLKGVAIAAVTKQLGLPDAAILSSDAKLGDDGSITVQVVEVVTEPQKVEVPATPQAAVVQPIV